MQALYKMVASFLSVALIFTSAAPSFAQNRRVQNSPFKVSGNNALDNAVQKHVNKTLEQMENDTYWVNKGAAMVQQDCGGSLKCALNRLSGALNAVNGNPLKAVVCSKDESECVPALAYGQGAVQYATTNALYVKGEMAVDVSPLFIKLVTQYGVHSEADRKAAQKYLFGLVQRAYKDCDKVSANEDTSIWAPKRTNYCAEEVTAMAALAMLAKNEPERKQVASAAYSLMKSEYDSVGGGMIMTGGTVALGVLGTPDAYAKLEQFLTLDTIPGTAGNVWKGLNSPIESTAQNSYKANRKDGRFLNRINEKFLYLDQPEAKRQGFPTTSWQAAGIQYPYANTLEDVGLLLGAQSAQNGSAKRLATKIIQQANQYAKTGEQMAARVHLPVVVGIMDGWRQSNTSMNVPSKELVAFLYKGNWFDINEGTQRRIHQKAYEFGLRRNMVFDPPARDPQKIRDYVNYIKVKDASFAADIAAQFVLLNAIITKLPALAKGIPNAVRALKQRSMWVGTKDLISKLPRTSPMQKAKAVTQATAKRPVKSPVAKQPVQTTKKPVTQQMQAQVANKPNMGTESAKNTVITQTKPTKQPVQTVAKTEQPATQTSKAVPTAPKPGWLAKWMPDSWKKQMVNQMLRFSLSRYGVAALGPGTMPFTTNGLVAFAKNTPKVEQMVQVAKDGFASTEALSATAGASARTGAVNPGALALQNSAKTAAAIVNLNPVAPFMKAAAVAALTAGGAYTATHMGLLPQDGSELLRMAMLPGLVVTPGMIKPLLQMPFNGPVGGNGGAGVVRPKRLRIGQTPQFQKLKAAGAVQTQVAQAEPESRQVANGGKVVVNTPQTAPVQAHVSQVASGMAVTKPSQTASVVPLQNLASFTFKKSAEDLDDDEVEQLFKKFIENSTRIGFERYVDSSEENNAFLIIQTAAMQSVEDEDFSNDKVTEILNRWQQVMPLLGSQQDGSFNKLKYNERLGMKSSVKDIKINQFHIVHEIKKIPVTNTLPQTLASHIVVNKTADGFVESVKLKQGVTSGEIDAILTVLLPQGYTFRMGKHEFRNGNNPMLRNNQYQLHIHFEKIGEAKANTWAVDTNYVLNIDTKDLIQSAGTRLNDKKIADIYKHLFEKYLPKAWQTDYSGYIQSNFM